MSQGKTPIFYFLRIVKRNKPVHPKRYLRLIAFYSKILPSGFLGFLENIFYRKKLKKFKPEHPPLYILGHWRSGTSFLQSLLGESPQFVYHTKFQTFFPESFLLTEKTIKQAATAVLEYVGLTRSWDRGIAHNFSSLDTSSEIEISMMNQAKPYSFHWGQVFPKFWKYYFNRYLFWDDISESEIKNWKENVKYLNKKVNFLHPNCQVLVKNPGDTARVKAILDIYPDARFIFVHRNPYEVFYSSVKLWNKILSNLSLQEITLDEIKNAILYIYKRVHEKYFDSKKRIPADNLVEIAYEDLRKKPLKVMKHVYNELGIMGFDSAKPAFEKYVNAMKHKPTEYAFVNEDIDRINKEWAFIFKQLGYPMHDTGKNRMAV